MIEDPNSKFANDTIIDISNNFHIFVNNLFRGNETTNKYYVAFHEKLKVGFIPRIGDFVVGFYSKTPSSFTLKFPSFKGSFQSPNINTINFNLQAGDSSLAFKKSIFPTITSPYMNLYVEDLVGDIYIIYCNIHILSLRKIMRQKIHLFNNFYINWGAIYEYSSDTIS